MFMFLQLYRLLKRFKAIRSRTNVTHTSPTLLLVALITSNVLVSGKFNSKQKLKAICKLRLNRLQVSLILDLGRAQCTGVDKWTRVVKLTVKIYKHDVVCLPLDGLWKGIRCMEEAVF